MGNIVFQDEDGSTIAVPGPPPEAGQRSRGRAYRRAYQRTYFGTVSACLPRPVKDAFRDACRKAGMSPHAVIAEWVETWLELNDIFPFDTPMPPGCVIEEIGPQIDGQ